MVSRGKEKLGNFRDPGDGSRNKRERKRTQQVRRRFVENDALIQREGMQRD